MERGADRDPRFSRLDLPRTGVERERQKVLFVAAETGVRVPFAPPSSWIDSIPALQGSEVARDAGVFRAYHDAVFRAAFDEGADMRTPTCSTGSRSAPASIYSKFREALDSGSMSARLDDHKREADEFSALGYPTFILGDFPMIGIQPVESMRLLLSRYSNSPTRRRAASLATIAWGAA